MVKKELIRRIHKETGLTLDEVAVMIDSFFHVILDSLKAEESTTIVGFGTFKPRIKPEHIGKNPKNGRPILITRMVTPTFRFTLANRNKFKPKDAKDRYKYIDEPVINDNLDETK